VEPVEFFSKRSQKLTRAKPAPKKDNLKGVKITAVVAPFNDMEEGLDDWTKAYILIWQNIAENLNFSCEI